MECTTKQNRFSNIFKGVTSIAFPTFYTNSNRDLKFKLDSRSDKEKLRADYKKSTEEIKKGVIEFELLHRK